MNYRHAYHAGNFADVLKHTLLALIIEHLKRKPAPFRVIDTHAGVGVYDLGAQAAMKTGEWREGIGRILDATPPPAVARVLAPYLDVVRNENAPGEITRYPGSPLLARRLLRSVDRLVVNELHPDDRAELDRLFARDPQTKVLGLDGWQALKSLLPPKERRGVALVDPPFEEPDEFGRLAGGLCEAARRFATGIVMLWYPIKDTRAVAAFHREVGNIGLPKFLAVELMIRPPRDESVLAGCGLIILNPPFTLADDLAVVMPYFIEVLGCGRGAAFRVEWLREGAPTHP